MSSEFTQISGVVPVVRVRGVRDYNDWLQVGRAVDDPYSYFEIGEGLWSILCCLEEPEAYEGSTVRYLSQRDLDRMGASIDQMWDAAAVNTKKLMPEVPRLEGFVESGGYCFESESLVASFLTDVESWQKLADEHESHFYMAIVSDSFALTGRALDANEWQEISDGVISDFESARDRDDPNNREISPYMYILKNRRWLISCGI